VKGKGPLQTYWVAGLRRGPRHVYSCPDLRSLAQGAGGPGLGPGDAPAEAPAEAEAAGGLGAGATRTLPRSASLAGMTADDASEVVSSRQWRGAAYFRPPRAAGAAGAVPGSSSLLRRWSPGSGLGGGSWQEPGGGSWRAQKSLIVRL
jgi:hypothetical protein